MEIFDIFDTFDILLGQRGTYMGQKIIFASEGKIGRIDGSKITYYTSEYLEKYNKNRYEIIKKNSWKTEGQGARFMGVHSMVQDIEIPREEANITGIAFLEDTDEIIYTITVNNMSGIFSKNLSHDSNNEGHIIHKSNTEFSGIDYNGSSGQAVVTVSEESFEKHIALIDLKKGSYRIVTEGESRDQNPFWSRRNKDIIYYDSCGIGLNRSNNEVAFSNRFICKLDISAGTVEECMVDEKFNFEKPKEDMEGNLYFIKRPFGDEHKMSPGQTLKDIFLFPFRMLKAIFSWMNFFSMRYSGESLRSKGNNPAKIREKSQQEIFIEGNLINVENALKENMDSGEKYPGFAPRSWELVKMGDDGKLVTIKKGVLDFDIDEDGNIVYTNGNYVIRISKNGKEEKIEKVPMVTKVKIASNEI